MHINKIYIINMLFNVHTDEKMLRPTQVFINGLLWVVFFFGLEAGHPVLYSLHIGPIKFIFYTRDNLSPMMRLVPSFPLVAF